MIERPSLRSDGLDAVWDQVRRRLEARGTDNRGRLRLPPLDADARLALAAVLDRAPGATLDLAALEAGLARLGVGADLPSALAALGRPVSDELARRRAERAEARRAREAARAEAAAWFEEWAAAWIDEVIRAGGLRGLDADDARRLVRSVRAVLDEVGPTGELGSGASAPVSRVDLAARLLGSAHALDTGTRIEAATTRALVHRAGGGPVDGREAWERVGVHLDLTSGPALVWRLPLAPHCGLAPLVGHATELGVPLHLTQLALRRHPAVVAPGTPVLVVENPRLVEAAAQTASSTAVVAANGNPSGAVRLLLRQLLDGGADLRYHGDFDAAGLAICARMADAGLVPWRMTTADYRRSLAAAEAAGVDLPTDPSPCGPTPWDPGLCEAFNADRRIVHEERLTTELLEP